MYAKLRDDAPVYHVEHGDYWVLSRHSDVQEAVLDTARYSSADGLTVRYDERASAGCGIARTCCLRPSRRSSG